MNEELKKAYRRTSYWVETPAKWIRLRVGERSAELDELLGAGTPWALITADNPRSDPRPPAENRTRRTALAAELEWESHPAYGVGDDGKWQPEIGVLVVGIPRERAVEIGRRYGQNAILAGVGGASVELVLCEP